MRSGPPGDPGNADIVLTRLSANEGTPLWNKVYGDSGRQDATGLKVGRDGTVHLAGYLRQDATTYEGVDFGLPEGPLLLEHRTG